MDHLGSDKNNKALRGIKLWNQHETFVSIVEILRKSFNFQTILQYLIPTNVGNFLSVLSRKMYSNFAVNSSIRTVSFIDTIGEMFPLPSHRYSNSDKLL